MEFLGKSITRSIKHAYLRISEPAKLKNILIVILPHILFIMVLKAKISKGSKKIPVTENALFPVELELNLHFKRKIPGIRICR